MNDIPALLHSLRRAALAAAALLLLLVAPWLHSARVLPDFGKEAASRDVHELADWVFASDDAQGRAVVILDKKAARVFVFAPSGRLLAASAALLGAAIGDDTVPGVGDKPLDQVRPEEKTTAAGRYVAQPGVGAHGEDIVWIDYDAGLSMHRVTTAVPAERRLQRLASPSARDKRISFGCINLPVAFYERVLSPMVRQVGAVVYVLPEIRTPQQVFGAHELLDIALRPPR